MHAPAVAAHPRDALFQGETSLPALAPCEHIAGNRKLIDKALGLQDEWGPVFDITCDCEDGAPAGEEDAHVRMVASCVASSANAHGRAGARIHDPSTPFWQSDLDVLVGEVGDRLAYVTLPKCTSAGETARMIDYLRKREAASGTGRAIPVHVLIETHGALRAVHDIAALDGVQTLDFGLMDFVSGHHGAIGFDAMRSPGQFEHPLLVRAKSDVVAAALAHGVVPAHNVSLTLRDAAATRADAHRARHGFGFLRMWSVHPQQILPIVEAMRPSAQEVALASDVLLAAQAVQWGPIRHEETLHDRATYRYFWNVLQAAEAGGAAIGAAARAAFFSEEAATA